MPDRERLLGSAETLVAFLERARERFPGCELVCHTRRFGDVRVRFWLPVHITNPIAFNDEALSSGRWAVTQTELLYEYEPPNRQRDQQIHRLFIHSRFAFDGASIPRRLWSIDRAQFSPLEEHIWAALPHDFICEYGDAVLPRIIGDAIFGHVLEQLAVEKKLEIRQAIEMHAGVRVWSRFKEWVLKS